MADQQSAQHPHQNYFWLNSLAFISSGNEVAAVTQVLAPAQVSVEPIADDRFTACDFLPRVDFAGN